MAEPIRVLVVDDQALVREGLTLILDSQPDIEVVGAAADGTEALAAALALHPDVVLMDVRMPGVDGIAATAAIRERTEARVLMLTTYDLDEHVYAALRAGASGFLLKTMRGPDLVAGVRVVAAGEGLLAPTVTRRLIAEIASRSRGGAPATTGDSASITRPAPPGVPGPSGAPAPPDAPAPPAASASTGVSASTAAFASPGVSGLSGGVALSGVAALAGLSPRETDTLRALARGLSNVEIAAQLHITENTVKTHVSNVLAKLGLRDRVQAVVLAYESGLAGMGDSR